jgi:glycerol transport system ATP-binding protein
MSLTLENVGKTVGRETHIADVDLTLEPGRFYVLLGPTLAGKTTLMRLMAGLERPTRGRVLVDGRDVTGTPVRKRNVAMVYQQFINYPSFTVYDNIASPLRRAGLSRDEVERRVRESAEILKLDNLLERLPGELSGGQQQRTALARALVKDAGLLLLDEPLVNLDYKLREELRVELRQIFSRRSAVVVYATTEPSEALIMGGDTVVLNEGRVLQHGATHDVYHHPASMQVGRIFSDPPMNFIPGEVAGGEAWLGGRIRLPLSGHFADIAPGRYSFGVRANHLGVVRNRQDDIAFAASVELAEISGSETFVHVDVDGTAWVVQEEGVHSLGLGEDVEVFVNPSNVFAFDAKGWLVASPPRPGARQAAE